MHWVTQSYLTISFRVCELKWIMKREKLDNHLRPSRGLCGLGSSQQGRPRDIRRIPGISSFLRFEVLTQILRLPGCELRPQRLLVVCIDVIENESKMYLRIALFYRTDTPRMLCSNIIKVWMRQSLNATFWADPNNPSRIRNDWIPWQQRCVSRIIGDTIDVWNVNLKPFSYKHPLKVDESWPRTPMRWN